jgi:hypothetical protein
MTETTPYNSTYKKLAVQWLNEALCFVSSSVLADSFRLRNRQLLVAAKRYQQEFAKSTPTNSVNKLPYFSLLFFIYLESKGKTKSWFFIDFRNGEADLNAPKKLTPKLLRQLFEEHLPNVTQKLVAKIYAQKVCAEKSKVKICRPSLHPKMKLRQKKAKVLEKN